MPQLIEESFDQILATAAAITDPFEQAFFVLVQQRFETASPAPAIYASRGSRNSCVNRGRLKQPLA